MSSEDSGGSYFIRNRARVTGPHAADELSRMVRRGSLSRAHEISRDAVNWAPAGHFPELFGGSPGPSLVSGLKVQEAPVTPLGMYYQIGNETLGPVAQSFLESMATNGSLPADAVVWIDGDTHSHPASSHPLLCHLPWAVAGDPGEDSGSAQSGKSGCGLMLLIGVVLLLGAGIGTAIWLSSSTTKSTPEQKTPTSMPAGAPPAASGK